MVEWHIQYVLLTVLKFYKQQQMNSYKVCIHLYYFHSGLSIFFEKVVQFHFKILTNSFWACIIITYTENSLSFWIKIGVMFEVQ